MRNRGLCSQAGVACVVAFGLVATLGACGPITATSSISAARYALEMATEAEAERRAVYEYVSAVAYLEKAREEWGTSDYQRAEEYADRAIAFAEAALERANATEVTGVGGRGDARE